jgi:hypothetical protein
MNAWEAVQMLIVFGTIGTIVKLFLDYRIRQKLIEKGMVDEKAKFLNFGGNGHYASSSLKWGIVLTFVGAGILIVKALPYYVHDEVVLGVIFIAAGAGLLTYYILADIQRRRSQREQGRP